MIRFAWTLPLLAALAAPALAAETIARDHYVPAVSELPAIAGQKIKLYVRERALPSVIQ